MDINHCGVNFAGKVDKSVYKWAKEAKKEAKENVINQANYEGVVAQQKDIDAIDTKTDAMMKVLEQKAAVMHPDTVITIDRPCGNRERFLCVHNDKLQTELRETPFSKTENNPWDRLNNWKVAGRNAGKYGFDGPQGTQLLELLEERINNIDETKTDKYLFKKATEYAVKRSEKGVSKELQKQIDNIVSVQEDLGFKSNFLESINKNRIKAEEKADIRRQNEELREQLNENTGFWKTFIGFFTKNN